METVEVINQRLVDHFGRFEDGRPNWRVSWSDDQYENRWVTHTPEGLELPRPEVREMKKYWYIRGKYILERLQGIEDKLHDLTTKTSYECVWTFEDRYGNPLPPDWDAIYLLINKIWENIFNPSPFAKYKEPEELGNTKEAIAARVEKLQEQLFGNETPITDSLANDSAVGYGVRQRKDWLH